MPPTSTPAKETGRGNPRFSSAFLAASNCARVSRSCCSRISVAVACSPASLRASAASRRARAKEASSAACVALSASSLARSSEIALISAVTAWMLCRRGSPSTFVPAFRPLARCSARASSSAYRTAHCCSFDAISSSRRAKFSSSRARRTSLAVSSVCAAAFAVRSVSCAVASRCRWSYAARSSDVSAARTRSVWLSSRALSFRKRSACTRSSSSLACVICLLCLDASSRRAWPIS